MGDRTSIAWTDATWIPLTGCTRVSPGCDSCYAYQLHDQRHVAWKRGRLPNAAAQYHQPFSTVQLLRHRLPDPLRWKRGRLVFLTSMGDVFHEDVPDGFILDLWRIMAHAPQHVFQILTKRPQRMRDWVRRWGDVEGDADFVAARGPDAVRQAYRSGRAHLFADMIEGWGEPKGAYPLYDWAEGMRYWPRVFRHMWLGVTAENQQLADERLPLLLDTPAALRWASLEPLLGPVNLAPYMDPGFLPTGPRLRWVVVGGESGPRPRPMDAHWLEQVVAQCRDAGVPVFVTQASGRFPGKQGNIPDELWLKEFPRAEMVGL